jgi:plastocyanin
MTHRPHLPARALTALTALLVFAALGGTASAATTALPGAHISAVQTVPSAAYPGQQHLTYMYGPITITPGMNTIEAQANTMKPQVPGFITRFSPDLVYAKVNAQGGHDTPRVDVIHLHHGVWLVARDGNIYPTFAAGEEKTIFNVPQGYGYHYNPSDGWIMNYMIHNLTPNETKVYIKYELDFVPDSEPAAAGITNVKPLWMDVSGIKPYPVFDALKGSGKNGKYTFPTDAKGAARKDIGIAHQWTAPQDITLVSTAGHLHPGGLYNDLTDTRGGKTQELFRSEAKYFEPAGAVSWDVALTGTKPDWRVAVKAGDTIKTTVTYDTSQASWYESMGIMVVFYADGIRPEAKDPFVQKPDWHGLVTHGHLHENDNHGGGPDSGLPDASDLLDGSAPSNVNIKGFIYGKGDLNLTGPDGRPPVIHAGQSVKFTNLDATKSLTPEASAYHTITACKQPCTGTTGIAYPLANANVQFDSGELGYGPDLNLQGYGGKFTPAANRNTWQTPKDLSAGTYTYFCRIHPFMRGAFRVVSKHGKGSVTKKTQAKARAKAKAKSA